MVNLEHILPKSFPSKNWPSYDQDMHFKFALLLWNLTIMSSNENKVAGQESFADKKKIYAQSQIKLTSEIAEIATWQPKDIEKRQNDLADLAVKRWST